MICGLHSWVPLRIDVKSYIKSFNLKVANLCTVVESPVHVIYEVGLCLCSYKTLCAVLVFVLFVFCLVCSSDAVLKMYDVTHLACDANYLHLFLYFT